MGTKEPSFSSSQPLSISSSHWLWVEVSDLCTFSAFACSHPYTTSPSDIFAHGYNFIETNPSKHNLAKLTNKQVTQKL